MSKPPIKNIFISAVSSEFSEHRKEIARLLKLKGINSETQENFNQHSGLLLTTVENYIKRSDAVIFLVGSIFGAKPSEKHFADFDHAINYNDYLDKINVPFFSYTQWEYLLAKKHNKPAFVFYSNDAIEILPEIIEAIDPIDVSVFQQNYRNWLSNSGKHYYKFNGITDLAEKILTLPELINIQRSKPFNLPFSSLNDKFIGRNNEIELLHKSLNKTDKKAAVTSIYSTALHGLGGIGKTRLAIEYASKYKSEYDAILFVIADKLEFLKNNIADLCKPAALDIEEVQSLDIEIQYNTVLKWLHDNSNWLLIFDNVDNEASAKSIMKLIPYFEEGQIIITTRLSSWANSVSKIQLGVLEPLDALDLLLISTNDRVRTGNEEELGKTIVENLGYLAVAIEQASSFINYRSISFESYLEVWNNQHEKAINWHDETTMEYHSSVAQTWLTTYSVLSEVAQKLLNRLSWFGPESIPNSILKIQIEAIEPNGIEAAFFELKKYSMVQPNFEKEEFTIHRLVQDVTRQWQQKDTNTMQLAESLNWLNDAFAGDPRDVRNWPVLEPIVQHCIAVCFYAEQSSIYDPTARLLNQVGLLYLNNADYTVAEPLMLKALLIDETIYGQEHPNVAIRLNNLAQLLHATNRLSEAEPLMRRALLIDETSYGQDHPNVAIRLNNLAILLQVTNRLSEAEPLMRRALLIAETS